MKTIYALFVALSFPLMGKANSFAIVIDDLTLQHTRKAVTAYQQAVEYDGLKTYVIHAHWRNPQQVRDSLISLYQRDRTLEGIVLVGDIPVAMIRNAQHMTSAFKMNEKTFSIRESSVPSDRFYDDLHLKFKSICQDQKDSQLFYYKLTEDSPQTLSPTFYSARIRYTKAMGGDKYQAISGFLNKAAKAKYQLANPLDQVVSYNGGGYNADCLMVYMDEEKAYRENFPLAFTTGTGFKHWNFRMHSPMKYHILDELKREDLDLFMFHEHGTPTQQLVNENPTGQDDESRYRIIKSSLYNAVRQHVEKKHLREDSLQSVMLRKYHLLPGFFKDYKDSSWWKEDSVWDADLSISTKDLKGRVTNAQMVMLDACYNGSFQDDDQVGGYYLFNPGKTLVVQGNTRNVLQDRWTIEMVGLLSHGVRVGQYNQLIATLEGHLLGDPTVHFAPIKDQHLSIGILEHKDDADYWKQLLSHSQDADVRALALRKLADLDSTHAASSFFLKAFQTEHQNVVRMEALKMLSRYANDDFTEAVRLGLRDPYERIARSCADFAGEIGDSRLIPYVIDVLFADEERIRVQYALNSSLLMFPEEKIQEAVSNYLSQSNRVDKEQEMEDAQRSIHQQFEHRNKMDDAIFGSGSEKEKIQAIRFLRNYPRTPHLSRYLEFLSDHRNSLETRVTMAEALGWFVHSYRRSEIINTCKQLLQEKQPEELHDELLQTINRLK